MKPKLTWKIITYLILIFWAVFTIMPLYWLLSTTFKPSSEAIGYPPTLIPRHPTLKNFGILLFQSRFGFKSYMNSITISLGATLISTFCAMLAGYGFSRFEFPLKNQILVMILLLQMIPLLAVIIPLYKLFSLYGLYDTRIGLVQRNDDRQQRDHLKKQNHYKNLTFKGKLEAGKSITCQHGTKSTDQGCAQRNNDTVHI